MQLTTDIKPRRDGKLTAMADDGTAYEFKDDGAGRLVADIANEDHVSFLLDSGNFYPADEAETLDADENEDDGGDDAPPVESNTPAKPKGPAKPKAKKAE